jgi:hypothetical protein
VAFIAAALLRPGPEEVQARLSREPPPGLTPAVVGPMSSDLVRLLRQHLDDADVEEIVRWQMTGLLARKAPVHNRQPYPRCGKCGSDWHGLPREECPGSFDTPTEHH